MSIFETEDQIVEYFMEHGAVWLSVVSRDSWPYILTTTEDGDVFTQTFPTEAEEGDTFRGTKWLCDMGERWYPVRMVAADPAPALPDRSK